MGGYTDAQLEAGIVNALRERNLEAVRDLLLVLSVQSPNRAEAIRQTMIVGLDIAAERAEHLSASPHEHGETE